MVTACLISGDLIETVAYAMSTSISLSAGSLLSFASSRNPPQA
jgi:hypothetical protein